MGFSATGNLLPGSVQRPDIATFVFLEEKGGSDSTKTGPTNYRLNINSLGYMPVVSSLNILSYVPVVSTITGLGRALLGLVHTIVHLACSIFSKNRDHHLAEAKLGAKNIGRGLVEAIPVIGNITMLIVDLKRTFKFEKMAQGLIDKNKAAYNNHAIMFIYGQEIAKRPMDEFKAELNKLNRKPTGADIERIIRN